MPKDPTSPDNWKVHDLSEAVALVTNWTGLNTAMVQEVFMTSPLVQGHGWLESGFE